MTVLFFAGLLAVVAGVTMVFPPAGLIVAGGSVMMIAWMADRGDR